MSGNWPNETIPAPSSRIHLPAFVWAVVATWLCLILAVLGLFLHLYVFIGLCSISLTLLTISAVVAPRSLISYERLDAALAFVSRLTTQRLDTRLVDDEERPAATRQRALAADVPKLLRRTLKVTLSDAYAPFKEFRDCVVTESLFDGCRYGHLRFAGGTTRNTTFKHCNIGQLEIAPNSEPVFMDNTIDNTAIDELAIRQATLDGSKFIDVDIRKSTQLDGVTWKQCTLDRVRLAVAWVYGGTFQDGLLRAQVDAGTMADVSVERMRIELDGRHIHFKRATFRDCVFPAECQLHLCTFEGVVFEGCTFEGATVGESFFDSTRFVECHRLNLDFGDPSRLYLDEATRLSLAAAGAWHEATGLDAYREKSENHSHTT